MKDKIEIVRRKIQEKIENDGPINVSEPEDGLTTFIEIEDDVLVVAQYEDGERESHILKDGWFEWLIFEMFNDKI